MSELRLNVVTKEWVIIAPERAARPFDYVHEAKPATPPFASACPFCPGNESLTTTEVFRIQGNDGAWATIGTANLDRLSLRGNYEVNLEILDEGLAQQMEEIFEVDQRNTHELTVDEWRTRSVVAKGTELLLSPWRPIF